MSLVYKPISNMLLTFLFFFVFLQALNVLGAAVPSAATSEEVSATTPGKRKLTKAEKNEMRASAKKAMMQSS